MALTFDPNPKIFFHDVDNFNLFTNEQKIKAFAESGLDGGFFQRVNQDFLSTPYQEFYHNLLRSGLNANHIVIGENFRFGHKRTGTIDWLRDTARSEGVSVYVEPPFLHDGQPVSSSRIRHDLISGNIGGANAMLGRPYSLSGRILEGLRLGKTLGFPTANLGDVHQLVPAPGVYAGYTAIFQDDVLPAVLSLPEEAMPTVFNMGHTPTVRRRPDDQGLKIEGHIIDRQFEAGALYGKQACFYLTHRLRDEVAFPGIAELKAQISRDRQQARRLLSLT